MEFGPVESCRQSASTYAAWQQSRSTREKGDPAKTPRVCYCQPSFYNGFFLRPSNFNSEHRALLPVDKIGKRAFHSLKRVSRFFLGPMEGVRDPRFDAANNSAFIFSVIIVFHVFHARTGKHSFCAPDSAASRPDVYRPDWARRFI